MRDTLATLGPVYMLLGYLPLLQRAVTMLVSEKEKRSREAMRMAGMGDLVFGAGMYLTLLLLALVPLVLSAMLAHLWQLYTSTSTSILFVLLLLYVQCLLLMAFVVSVFFRRSKTAGQWAAGVLFLLLLPAYLFGSGSWLDFSSLSPPVAFARGWRAIVDAESDGVSLRLLTAFNGTESPQSGMRASLFFLSLDAALLALLAFYLDQVVPQDYGLAKHPLWFLGLGRNSDAMDDSLEDELAAGQPNDLRRQSSRYSVLSVSSSAPVPSQPVLVEEPHFDAEVRPGIRLVQVRKRFDARSVWERAWASIRERLLRRAPDPSLEKKMTHALRGLSLTAARGECLALLGPNASGKSTTVSILSGLLPADAGRVLFEGMGAGGSALPLAPNTLSTIRDNLFVCPQLDLLWERLTVWQHLAFYAQLRGVPPERLQVHIREKLTELQLADKENERVMNLSGGQKRKLCVLIALMGVERCQDDQQAHECRDVLFFDESETTTIMLHLHFANFA